MKLPPPDSYDVAIAALFVRVADRKGNVGLPDDERALVDQMFAAGKPDVVIAFGSPYSDRALPGRKTWIAEFSTNDVSQRAAVRALFGQVAMQGQIPVTVPGTRETWRRHSQLPANPMTLQPRSAYMTDELRACLRSVGQFDNGGGLPWRRAGRWIARSARGAAFRKAHARRESAAGNRRTPFTIWLR